jgi:hypothetical protein
VLLLLLLPLQQALRPRAGSWMYIRFNVDELSADEISAGQYLAFKEQLVEGEGGGLAGVLLPAGSAHAVH